MGIKYFQIGNNAELQIANCNTRVGKAGKSWKFDPEEPCQIIGACKHVGLTIKEADLVFLHLATEEPYPSWSEAEKHQPDYDEQVIEDNKAYA
jgi:hypothetical protein